MTHLPHPRAFDSSFASRTLRRIAIGAVAVLLPSAAQAVDPEWASFCERYTNDAVAQATKNIDLKCGYGGPRWAKNREDHFNWCIAQDGNSQPPAIEGSHRVVGLKDCEAKILRGKAEELPSSDIGTKMVPPTPTPAFCTVAKSGDVYAASDGKQKTGVLAAGTQGVTLLGKEGAYWYHVKWPAGQGWVYSGPGYEDALECP